MADRGRGDWGSGQQDASGSEADAGSRNPGSGIASAMTERLYEDRADGSRAVSTKKEDPLSELQLREGVFPFWGDDLDP